MSSQVPMPDPVFIPDMDALRRTMRDSRQAQGLTQEQLAQRAGVNHRSVSAIERGDMDPSMRTLLLLFGVLGIGLGLLLMTKGGSQQNGSK